MLFFAFFAFFCFCSADIEAYDNTCGPPTARLFLESTYHEFLSKHKGVLHMQLLNHEHLWSADAAVHAKMQGFLCKTQFCMALMRQHVVNKGYWASVWFMSHTSSDPSVGLSGDIITGVYVGGVLACLVGLVVLWGEEIKGQQ